MISSPPIGVSPRFAGSEASKKEEGKDGQSSSVRSWYTTATDRAYAKGSGLTAGVMTSEVAHESAADAILTGGAVGLGILAGFAAFNRVFKPRIAKVVQETELGTQITETFRNRFFNKAGKIHTEISIKPKAEG